MAFFLSKEYWEDRAKEKESKRQIVLERKERERKLIMEYCDWYSQQTQNFINKLKEKGFNPSWGFEAELSERNLYTGEGGKQRGRIFVFDIPSLEGLAFDMKSKQMLYFTCPTGYFDSYQEPDAKVDFKYVLIPFSEIFKANIEVNSQPFVSTVSSGQNALSRSIVEGIAEGIFGDEGDDIIDWEEKDNFLVIESGESLRKVVLNIQTINPDYPVISFEFIKPYDPNPMCSAANKEIVDIMCSTFSSSTEKVALTEYDTRRKCKTIKDYCYTREKKASDEGRVSAIICIDTILERLNKYVKQIESIIQQCSRKTENQSYDIVLQLEKLADMKDKGIITQKEFIRLKKKLI